MSSPHRAGGMQGLQYRAQLRRRGRRRSAVECGMGGDGRRGGQGVPGSSVRPRAKGRTQKWGRSIPGSRTQALPPGINLPLSVISS